MMPLKLGTTSWLLASILLLALALRIYGIEWEQGHLFHPDERAILMKVGDISFPSTAELSQLLDPDASPLNPRWFPYGSFPLYLLKLATETLGKIRTPLSISEMAVLGRSLSALADVVTILVVYLLGARLYNSRVGLLAAALTAFAVLHIQLSHFYTVETIITPFILLSLLFLWRSSERGSLWSAALAGVFLGLALATKVSAAPMFISVLVAGLLFIFRDDGGAVSNTSQAKGRVIHAAKLVLLTAAFALVAFLLAEPYALLDWRRFLADVIEQGEMVRRIRDYPYTRQYIDTPAYLYYIQQLTVWGLGIPLGLVAYGGLLFAIGMAWKKRLRSDWLILSWVIPYFLITGGFQVKFLRYLLLISPLLILLGARMLIAWWDATSTRFARTSPMGRRLSPTEEAWLMQRYGPSSAYSRQEAPNPFLNPLWAKVAIGLVVGFSFFYSLAYVNLYSRPHTAVRTSQWIKANVPPGSTLAGEHWEEGLPDLGQYHIVSLPLYEADNESKREQMVQALSQADYLVFYSNRLYGTIPRLPERYPMTTRYYQLLFSGQLGYELAYFATSYPDLLGVSFVDDTFQRPGLPVPKPLELYTPSPMAMNLGYADESFTVYDHPKTMVFKRVRELNEGEMKALLGEARKETRALGLVYTPEEFQAQRQGGTWSDLFPKSGVQQQSPEMVWLLAVQAMGLSGLPLALLLFRGLPDRGYLFAWPLGLLITAYLPWLLASQKLLPFSRNSILLGVLLTAALSIIAYIKTKREIHDFFRRRWRLVLTGEALFLGAFLVFYTIRLFNPDLWHPYRGGEKPMDFAYLNAVVKSTYMPPYDPWFAGGYFNYYYYGQFLVATLIKLTGIVPSIAYNLAIPLFFAMTFTGAYSITYNLVESYRSRSEGLSGKMAISILAGVSGAVFVAVVGNLDGAFQVGENVWNLIRYQAPIPTFDYWRSSRMMPPTISITEFPFFTFLFADLHAHLMVMPFSIMALGLGTSYLLHRGLARDLWIRYHLPVLISLGFIVGSLRWINTWDFPTYLLLSIAIVFVAEFVVEGKLGWRSFMAGTLNGAVILLSSTLAYLPLQLSSQTFYAGVIKSPETTPLWQYLATHGLFLFIILSYLAYELIERFKGELWLWRRQSLSPADAIPNLADGPVGQQIVPLASTIRINFPLLSYGVLILAISSALAALGLSTAAFLAAILLLMLPLGLRVMLQTQPGQPIVLLVLMLVGLAFALGLAIEFVTVQGDIQRMNTVFKFYLQAWVLLGIASAFALWRLGSAFLAARSSLWSAPWFIAFGVLMLASLIYPILATPVRVKDRFEVLPPTRDGMAYMQTVQYNDAMGTLDLTYDWEAIRWIQDNVSGSPVILEGTTPLYRWGSRISIYTGLPTVVGWDWHQKQQRGVYSWAVEERQRDVQLLYMTTDVSTALSLLKKYEVGYVYVGELERKYYPPPGLSKFQEMAGATLTVVYKNPEVTIYRVEG